MKKYMKWGTVLMASFVLAGCFNLDEEVFEEVTEASFVPTEKDVAALIASAYSPMTGFIMNWQGYFDLQEESGDCIITPTRPNGWDDGGVYRDMHQHKWNDESWQPWNVYNFCFDGINNSNRVMDQIAAGALPMTEELQKAAIAELRAARALWYWILLDTHGNVPIVEHFTDEVPTQATRQQLYDFVVKELTEVIPDLTGDVNSNTYGRMNKWAAKMVLARTYLNAQVYTGTAHWADALKEANDIIQSGKYTLSADFSDNFKKALDYTNTECIFNVPYDVTYAGFQQHAKWYPPISRYSFGFKYQCWGGSCANPQFIWGYEGYDQATNTADDKRLAKSWVMGPQDDLRTPAVDVLWTAMNYLPSLTCAETGTSINYGYRVGKYEIDNETAWNWGNDFPFLRYAETLMIAAECMLRLGQTEDLAAQYVSQIRARAFDDPAKATVTPAWLKADTRIKYGTLDYENKLKDLGDQTPVVLGGLYDEYGIEFACEAQRRTHMIRFGTFSKKNWFNHTAIPDGHTAIFPIPLEKIQANSNLKQNPGY